MLAQTLTADPALVGGHLDGLVAALVALASLVAALERGWKAWKAGRAAEAARADAAAERAGARDTREVAAAIVEGVEDVLEALPHDQAERAKALLAKAAEQSRRFTKVRALVREVTHPEERPAEPGAPDFSKEVP